MRFFSGGRTGGVTHTRPPRPTRSVLVTRCLGLVLVVEPQTLDGDVDTWTGPYGRVLVLDTGPRPRTPYTLYRGRRVGDTPYIGCYGLVQMYTHRIRSTRIVHRYGDSPSTQDSPGTSVLIPYVLLWYSVRQGLHLIHF